VTAHPRIDNRLIAVRTSIAEPGTVIVLKAGFLHTVNVADGLREGGLALPTRRLSPEKLSAPVRARTATVDATGIALEHGLGSRTLLIVNTMVLGALAKASEVVSLEAKGPTGESPRRRKVRDGAGFFGQFG